jgi:hypothetical protein
MQRLARDDIPAVAQGDGVDFSPTEELKPVLDHITGGG